MTISTKQKLHFARLQYLKWLKSIGIRKGLEDIIMYRKTKVKSKPGELDLSYLKVRNSIPTSDRIPGVCLKKEVMSVQLPAGKTIGIGYNKGTYQVVDKSDFKTMGRKI